MSEEISFKVEGLKELSNALEQFPEKMQNKMITSALRAAAKPVVKDAKMRAQRSREPSSGALAESIGLKARRKGRRGGTLTSIYIAPLANDKKAALQYLSYWGLPLTGKNARIRHGHLVEFGHQLPGGGSVAPRPFMRPALESNKGRVISIFKTTLAKRIDALTKKLNKQAAKR